MRDNDRRLKNPYTKLVARIRDVNSYWLGGKSWETLYRHFGRQPTRKLDREKVPCMEEIVILASQILKEEADVHT